MPRRTNTNPNRAVSAARRTSIASVIVAPTPTAAPLTAAITGLVQSKTRSVSWPPLSSGTESDPPRVRQSNVSPPRSRSAPAQNARPAPVTITARTASSSSARSNASISSRAIVSVQAFMRSGRLRVIVRMPSSTSAAICWNAIGHVLSARYNC